MKKALSIILVLALACSLFGGAALAAASDYVLTGGNVTVDGTEDKTVEVVFTSVKGGTYYSFSGNWSKTETEGSGHLTLSALSSPAAATENSTETGRTQWTDMTYTGITVAANGAIWSATYTVDKNTPSGTYIVSLNVDGCTGGSAGFNAETDAQGLKTATITVTNKSTPAAEGYTVTAAADKTEVAVGDTVKITLDVTNSDKTTFNAFQGKLTYAPAVFTYSAAGSTLGDFDVSDSSGELTIIRHGSDVAIPGSGAELTLAFTAASAGTGTFTLSEVKVSEAETANTDASEATVSGTPSVTVSQTYTVTFVGGEGATGTAPTQDPVTAGTTITLPANPFTKDGYTFAGWKCSVDETVYDAGASYPMTAADTTFTAQWTENTLPETATASIVDGYLGGYTLIKVTTKNTDKAPTYDGKDMFKLSGTAYDADAYYYIVSGTVDQETAQGKLGWSDTAATNLTKDGDANQTGRIDINDAQFIYNLYNGVSVSYTPTAAQLLASDVNGDGKVDTDDCAASIAAIQ